MAQESDQYGENGCSGAFHEVVAEVDLEAWPFYPGGNA